MIKQLPNISDELASWPWQDATPVTADPLTRPWPKITVVTPSYNQGPFIEATIRSVLLQNYPNLEYIIIDGGSTDESLEVILRYANWIDYWHSRPDKGQADGVNQGWIRARGHILGWLNSDDLYLPGTLFRVAETWLNHPETQFVYGDAVETDLNLTPYKIKSMANYDGFQLLAGKNLPQPSVFLSKEFFQKIGLLDVKYQYALDVDFFLRCWFQGDKIMFRHINNPLAISRVYPHTKSESGGAARATEKLQVYRHTWKNLFGKHAALKWRWSYSSALTIQAWEFVLAGYPKNMVAMIPEIVQVAFPGGGVYILKKIIGRLLRQIWSGWNKDHLSRY